MLRGASCVVVVFAAGCGGMVVFEDDGVGGGGSSSSTSASSSKSGSKSSSKSASVSSTSGGPCAPLEAALDAALAQLTSCDPAISAEQCSGGYVFPDKCACPTQIVNDFTPSFVIDDAVKAYEDWVNAGCGPLLCRSCTPVSSGFCQPLGNGMGICTGFGPD